MKMFRLTFAAAAAALIMVAGVAAACGDKMSTTAEKKSCCAKGTAQTASHEGCAKGSAKTAGHQGCAMGVAKTASDSGCAKGSAKSASASGCAKAAGSSCCAKGQNTMAKAAAASDVKTCTFRPGAVAFKGTVLCNHCDLKKTETCQTMFRTDGGCVFTMAGDNVKQIREEAVGGKKIIRLKGNVSDSGELTVSSYRVVKTMDSGASAM